MNNKDEKYPENWKLIAFIVAGSFIASIFYWIGVILWMRYEYALLIEYGILSWHHFQMIPHVLASGSIWCFYSLFSRYLLRLWEKAKNDGLKPTIIVSILTILVFLWSITHLYQLGLTVGNYNTFSLNDMSLIAEIAGSWIPAIIVFLTSIFAFVRFFTGKETVDAGYSTDGL